MHLWLYCKAYNLWRDAKPLHIACPGMSSSLVLAHPSILPMHPLCLPSTKPGRVVCLFRWFLLPWQKWLGAFTNLPVALVDVGCWDISRNPGFLCKSSQVCVPQKTPLALVSLVSCLLKIQVKEMLLAHVNDLEEVNKTQYIATQPLLGSIRDQTARDFFIGKKRDGFAVSSSYIRDALLCWLVVSLPFTFIHSPSPLGMIHPTYHTELYNTE